ncbi:hypothetical protein [Sulfitobacter sp. S190]|uniref:hypothetical protein n=1 Tax=Sulfitobacter sp. S190 TaxID=2867022 RepID=UPI0021A840C6|nr:hypothetical protein [Sulfitobacter sp. S190]UWR22515.1 hypothetical protein K3756_00480 [Sulfitobacter sp. S190]
MRYRKEFVTAGGTLACAAGIGFLMQTTTSPDATTVARSLDVSESVMEVQDITLTSAEFDTVIDAPMEEAEVLQVAAPASPVPVAVETEAPAAPVIADETVAASVATPEPMCDITAAVRPMAAAMVNLTLDASCLPDERVIVHHSGMTFSALTSETGRFDLTVPALAEDAVFVMAFNNGEGAVAQTKVEELADFDRIVLQWKGETGFQLHAREFGADYGDAGHVWSGASRDMSYAVTGEGGYLSVLGDSTSPDALIAEVYTYPSGTASSAGKIDLSVETEVIEANCGLEIEGQTMQMQAGGTIRSRDLTLAVPDCDAAGNFLVLNNLFEDLKVASN